jgi:hypothetical protein
MSNRLPRVLRSALCSVFGVSLAACASTSPQVAVPEVVVVVVDTVEVPAAADQELEERIATLQFQLLERTAQVEDVQSQLEMARQEVVRQMARLQTLASRADAASAMAEAEIGVEALTSADGEEAPEAAQARRFLELSTAEFAVENYAGALYLASQARSLARIGDFRLTSIRDTEWQPREVRFALPVPLETLRRSNVRSGPGLNYRVLVTLDIGTPLVGRSHTELWVKITGENGTDGWIHHNLVGSVSGG